jgi:XTP/dITP diphosphohydrolase
MSRLRAVLATGNAGKAAELSRLLGADVEARALEVDEDADTYAGNALRKARAARAAADGQIGLGDDSGLEVTALNGEPGLRSARWAGPTDADRNAALLARLTGAADRSAAFVCSLAAVLPDGREIVVTERVEGELVDTPRGDSGFGYDPLFVPRGERRTVAELSPAEKDEISHRGRASRALAAALHEAGVS